MINTTLAILAGGKGSRMNYKNKAMITYNERTFIDYIIDKGKNFREVIIIANESKPYEKYNLRVVKDIYINCGPMAGIHSALKNSKTKYVLCIACDMPITSEEIIEYLGKLEKDNKIIIPECDGKIQPLCAKYSKELIEIIEKEIKLGKLKLKDFIENNNPYKIDSILGKKLTSSDFYNINTEYELKVLEGSYVKGRDNYM